MKIKLLQGIEGAKKATGISVIIDVFRAFTVEAYLMNNGAKKIIPVGDIKTAYQYKKDHSQYLLIGERNGKQQVGFDYGNSPTQIASVDVEGKTIIHTTSSGTQGIVNAVNAEEILTGSLVNAKAIATYIKRKNPQEVSLVSMGLAGRKETEEDTLCANYIKSLLEDKELDITKEIESLKLTSGSKFFKKELIRNIRFDESMQICEDTYFVCHSLKKADKIYYVGNSLYLYRIHPNSTVNNIQNMFDNDGNLKYMLVLEKILMDGIVESSYRNYIKADECVLAINVKCDYLNSKMKINKKTIKKLNDCIKRNFIPMIICDNYSIKKKLICFGNALFNLRKFKYIHAFR